MGSSVGGGQRVAVQWHWERSQLLWLFLDRVVGPFQKVSLESLEEGVKSNEKVSVRESGNESNGGGPVCHTRQAQAIYMHGHDTREREEAGKTCLASYARLPPNPSCK